MQASASRSSSVLRRLNLPPSYVLIHRVLASGLGVLCQLECEVPFRAEVLRWMPGYADTAKPAPPASANGHTGSAPAVRPEERARSMPPAGAEPQKKKTTTPPARSGTPDPPA